MHGEYNVKYKTGIWNVWTLNQRGKLENLKDMENNAVSVVSVSDWQWKGQGEIRSGD
jgi:hypothetical protein